jgi:hypothetical protein
VTRTKNKYVPCKNTSASTFFGVLAQSDLINTFATWAGATHLSNYVFRRRIITDNPLKSLKIGSYFSGLFIAQETIAPLIDILSGCPVSPIISGRCLNAYSQQSYHQTLVQLTAWQPIPSFHVAWGWSATAQWLAPNPQPHA